MKNEKKNKYKDLLLKNFPLKLLAVVIAMIAWVVIVNVDNPSEKVTISGIPVELLNTDSLTDDGYIYTVESGATLTITVKAPKTISDTLRISDFRAYADLENVSPSSGKAKIQVECVTSTIAKEIDIVDQKTDYVKLSIDTSTEKEFNIEVEITGDPSEGYIVGDYSISPTTIKVSGAKSIVDTIETAKITYNVDNMTANIEDSVTPVFYDEYGKEVKTDKLKLNRDSVKVAIEILPTKTIPVNYEVIGTPAEGYTITSTDSSCDSIVVAATKDVLNTIDSIDIPQNQVDVSGLAESTSIEINLKDYLPSGCTIISGTETLEIDINIQKIGAMTVTFNMSDITIMGTDEAYDYEITNKGTVYVSISGLDENIAHITVADLNPQVDVSGKEAGNYNLKIDFDENDLYTVDSVNRVNVKITEKSGTDDTEASIEVPVELDDITLIGQKDGYDYEIVTTTALAVSITGQEDDISDITVEDLRPQVDVSGLGEGTTTIAVTFKNSNLYSIEDAYNVTIKVVSNTEETETDEQ